MNKVGISIGDEVADAESQSDLTCLPGNGHTNVLLGVDLSLI